MFPHLQDPLRCPSRRSWPLAVTGPRSRSVILLTPDVMSVELYTMGALEKLMYLSCSMCGCEFGGSMGGSEFRSFLCHHLVPELFSHLEMVSWLWKVLFRSSRAFPVYLSSLLDHLLIYITSMASLSILFYNNMSHIHFY